MEKKEKKTLFPTVKHLCRNILLCVAASGAKKKNKYRYAFHKNHNFMDENVVQSFQEPKFSRMWLKNPNLKEYYVAVVCKAETLEAEALELVSQLTTGETVRQLESISLFYVTWKED